MASGRVGVVVPMFNAERTITDTLESIQRQTYDDLEIIVVDDGSSDRSPSLVAEAARRDRRIRLVRQVNVGVAAARNRGAASTSCGLLAFVDADDLWAPQKIQRQIEVLEKEPSIDVVYCWFTQICDEGRMYPTWRRTDSGGNMLQRLCRHNLIGNGSSLLVRRSAFVDVGGFDASLRQRGAQGCEDWLFCLRLAEAHQFGVVPDDLVGYRQHAGNMSNDGMQMFRSMELIVTEYRQRFPQYAAELDAHWCDFVNWMAIRLAGIGDRRAALVMAAQLPAAPATELRAAVERSYRAYLKKRLLPRPVRRAIRSLPLVRRNTRPPYLRSLGRDR